MEEPADEWCMRNRGTEFVKSPEMLTIANASRKDRAAYDPKLSLYNIMVISLLLCIIHGHESTLYYTDFDEVGVVGLLALSANQRRQNDNQPSDI